MSQMLAENYPVHGVDAVLLFTLRLGKGDGSYSNKTHEEEVNAWVTGRKVVVRDHSYMWCRQLW